MEKKNIKVSITQNILASQRLWLNEKGILISYENLSTDSLINILSRIETQGTHYSCHYEELKKELLKRNTEMGKILYE